MALFQWKRAYDTGIAEIDSQHKVLVSLINELAELIETRFDPSSASLVFGRLKDYAVFHFSTEEGLMARYNYVESDLHAHLAQHRQFEQEFEFVQADFENLTVAECRVILAYLTNWLINHICKVDRRLAAFILAQRGLEGEKTLQEKSRHVSAQLNTGSINGYLSIARIHVSSADNILEQLEQCVDELREKCGGLIKSGEIPGQLGDSNELFTRCEQSRNLIKSLQSGQVRLKLLLEHIEQGSKL